MTRLGAIRSDWVVASRASRHEHWRCGLRWGDGAGMTRVAASRSPDAPMVDLTERPNAVGRSVAIASTLPKQSGFPIEAVSLRFRNRHCSAFVIIANDHFVLLNKPELAYDPIDLVSSWGTCEKGTTVPSTIPPVAASSCLSDSGAILFVPVATRAFVKQPMNTFTACVLQTALSWMVW
ncbi:hypothetical protein IG631_20006 [Alternaria alternata]|nr:hypothetical protein IG631_20006 [Alternaria alternata]